MSAEGARLLVGRQRARNRIFIAVAASAALLDAAIVVVLAAAISRAVAGVIAALAAVTVMAAISAADAAWSAGRVRRRVPRPDEAGRLEPMVGRLAEGLGINPPTLCIADDDAVNAFAAYSGPKATVFYASGFVAEFGSPGDEPLVEAVTAHLLARIATGDTRLTVVMDGLLNWALFLVRWVIAGFVWVLGRLGWGYVTSDAHKRLKPASHVYGDDMVNRLIVWGISVVIGLCLIMAAVAVALLGGVLALVAHAARFGLMRQQIRIADSIATELTGDVQSLRTALQRLSDPSSRGERPVDLDHRGRVLRDLCFTGTSRCFPSPLARAAEGALSQRSGNTGLLLPVASALAVACLVGGAGVLAARIPYGQPFGGAGGSPLSGGVQGAVASGGSGQATVTPGIPATGSSGPLTTVPATPAGQSSPTGARPGATPSTGASTPVSTGSGGASGQPPPVPATPGGVTATALDQFTIEVSWAETSSPVTGFNVDNGCPTGSCAPGATLAQTTGPVSSTDFTVTPGSYQCFRVQALNASAVSGWSSYGCTSTPGLVLAGTPAWTNTGVTVASGIELGLSASGTMTVDGGRQVDPSGDQSCIPDVTYPGASPPFAAPALHCWALVARIGNGPPFEIGTTFTQIIGQAGSLYLSVNGDSMATYPGSWTVKIKKGGPA